MALSIERATQGLVTTKDLRPDLISVDTEIVAA
jgi:DNA-binding transcriptional regulator YdaS (Cro superfamily)